MNRGKFISDILVVYQAFLHETMREAGTYKFGGRPMIKRHFTFAYDTALAGCPVFTSEDELFDYSPLCDMKVTKDNYKDFMNDNVKRWKITDLSESRAKEIMHNNITALLRIEKLQEKAERIKVILG